MALIIPVGFAQVTVPFRHSASPREAVCTFGVDDLAYAGDFEDMCNDICERWHTYPGSLQDTEVTIGPVRARIGQDGGDPLAVEGTTTFTGTRSQDSLPTNVALLVQKRTGIGGRRGRGRMFIPWIIKDVEANDVGGIAGDAVTAFQDAFSAFFNALASGTAMTAAAPMYLLHDAAGIGTEPPPSELTGLTVDNRVATQRRRLGR